MSRLVVTQGAAPKQILAVVDPQVSFTVQMAQSAATEVNGRLIIKAGTPLTGDLKARNTAFTEAESGENIEVVENTESGENTEVVESNAVGVALHDYDVTDGDATGALLVFGFVDLKKVDADIAAKITSDVEAALQGKVTFIK